MMFQLIVGDVCNGLGQALKALEELLWRFDDWEYSGWVTLMVFLQAVLMMLMGHFRMFSWLAQFVR